MDSAQKELVKNIEGASTPTTVATPVVSEDLQKMGAQVPGHELPGPLEEGVEVVGNTIKEVLQPVTGASSTRVGRSWFSRFILRMRMAKKAQQLGGEVQEVKEAEYKKVA